MHLWHELELGNIKQNKINAIIEIPSKSKVKYELDKDTGLIMVDRILSSSMVYPHNYGFLPKTYCDDGDPLDVLVFSQCAFVPGSLVKVKIIGGFKMIDGKEQDDKLLAIHLDDPLFKNINDIKDLPKHSVDEIKNFFETYKLLEKKSTDIKSTLNKEKAQKILEQSVQDYQKKFQS